MLKFDEQTYLENAAAALARRAEVERVADEIADRGYKNLFFVSVGGSLVVFDPFQYIAKQLTKIPVFVEHAAEIVLTGHTHLCRDSIVFMTSKSGDTKESVAAARYMRQRGIPVVSFVGDPQSPLGQNSDWVLSNKDSAGLEYPLILMLFLRLLNRNGEFPDGDYRRYVSQLEVLPQGAVTNMKRFDPLAQRIAREIYEEPYQIWIGSGEMWGQTYSFSMCIMEEMQWKRTKSVTSPEFFHGTLELADNTVPVFLVKGEGACRPLDDRAEKFLRQYAPEKLHVLDIKEYPIEGLDEAFRWLLGPSIFGSFIYRLSAHHEQFSGHDLSIRRYYRQFDY